MDIKLKIVEKGEYLLNISFTVDEATASVIVVAPEFAAYMDYASTKQNFPFLKPFVYEVYEGIIYRENPQMLYCVLDFKIMLESNEEMFLEMIKMLLIKALSEINQFHKVKEKPIIVYLSEETIELCKAEELLIMSNANASKDKKFYN